MKKLLFLLLILSVPILMELLGGCAQILAPTGGAKDTLAPVLVSANPAIPATNFRGNRITLYFDEYVHLEELQKNLLVSPTPRYNPYIDSKLRSVTIRLRDTLEPNTTYTINLGDAIRDINENNPVKDFSYVFSTGNFIDSLTLSGKIRVAETGKADSTLIAMLYNNTSDTAVQKLKPKYIARLDGAGNFKFKNLSAGEYRLYGLKDNDGSRSYNSKSELFAFAPANITVGANNATQFLYAYAEEKEVPKATVPEKKLVYSAKVKTAKQDVLSDLVLEFNRPLKDPDLQKIRLTDTLNNSIAGVTVSLDTSARKVIIKTKWQMNAVYKLFLQKDFATDSAGLALAKSDTIRFLTKKEEEYGIVRLKFTGLDLAKNPVLQFVQDDAVQYSFPLTSTAWNAPLFNPGEYELRILFDDNRNGKWDAGDFALKKQPEKVYSISQKLSVRENFEKDVDIILPPGL